MIPHFWSVFWAPDLQTVGELGESGGELFSCNLAGLSRAHLIFHQLRLYFDENPRADPNPAQDLGQYVGFSGNFAQN